MREVLLVAGRDPLSETSGGHSNYVRAHARAAIHAGLVPHLFCASRRDATVETDFGIVHHIRSPFRPFRQLLIAGHGPRIAAGIERFAASRPGPHLIHGFGVWGYAGLLASRRLRRRGLEAIPLVSSYTTYEEESRSKVRGLGAYRLRDRVRFHAEHLWIRTAVERYERRAYVESRRVLVNYESVRRLISAKYGDLPHCIRAPYGAELAFLPDPAPASGEPPPPLAGLRPADAPLIVAISRHDPRKGVDVLLQALASLRGQGVPFRACLAGGGPLLQAHRRLASRLGLDSAVAIPGIVPDVAPYLGRADLFVLPSREEQSGSVAMLEAFQAGVAVVASGMDGILEDVVDGEDALLARPGDTDSLAWALGRGLRDPQLRQRLARRGRKTFEERFAAGVFARGLRAVYDDLWAAAGRAAA